MESNSSGSGSLTIMNAVGGMRIENPFTFKVFQLFTGFGVGCGVGIGAGSPLNLGEFPSALQTNFNDIHRLLVWFSKTKQDFRREN